MVDFTVYVMEGEHVKNAPAPAPLSDASINNMSVYNYSSLFLLDSSLCLFSSLIYNPINTLGSYIGDEKRRRLLSRRKREL